MLLTGETAPLFKSGDLRILQLILKQIGGIP